MTRRSAPQGCADHDRRVHRLQLRLLQAGDILGDEPVPMTAAATSAWSSRSRQVRGTNSRDGGGGRAGGAKPGQVSRDAPRSDEGTRQRLHAGDHRDGWQICRPRYRTDEAGHEFEDDQGQVQASVVDYQNVGLEGTPSFFINGVYVGGFGEQHLNDVVKAARDKVKT
jgi:hypothetical protein